MMYGTCLVLPGLLVLATEASLAVVRAAARRTKGLDCDGQTDLLLGRYVLKVPTHLLRTCRLLLGYLLGAGLVLSLTHLLKYWLGVLRPHFLDVCKVDWETIDCEGYSLNYTCLLNVELFPGQGEAEEMLKQV